MSKAIDSVSQPLVSHFWQLLVIASVDA